MEPREFSSSLKWFLVSICVSIALAGFAICYVSYSEPTPPIIKGAQQLLEGKKITEFQNVGAMILVFIGLRFFGHEGIYLINTLIYLLIVSFVFLNLRRLKLKPSLCFLGAILVSIHPILFANIKRVTDYSLSTLLLLMFIYTLLITKDSHIKNSLRVMGWGLLFTLLLLARPNFLLLILLVGIYEWKYHREHWLRVCLRVGAIAFIGIFLASSVNYMTKGKFMLTDPYYAAETFYCGANPYTAKYLFILRSAAIEDSIPKALKEKGINKDNFDRDQLTKMYFKNSFEFIKEKPLYYLGLLLLKTAHFFAPNYRRIFSSEIGNPWFIFILQTVLALPFFLWLMIRWKVSRTLGQLYLFETPLLIILYALPFILIYAEPRYRWPLDIVLIVDTVYLLSCYLKNSRTLEYAKISSFKP